MSKLNIHLADTLLPPLVDQPATHRSLIKRKVETLIYYVIRLWIWPWIGYYTGGPGTKLIRQRFRSFEENDEKLINRIVSANTCLSKHLSREYFISFRVKDLEFLENLGITIFSTWNIEISKYYFRLLQCNAVRASWVTFDFHIFHSRLKVSIDWCTLNVSLAMNNTAVSLNIFQISIE